MIRTQLQLQGQVLTPTEWNTRKTEGIQVDVNELL